MYYKYSIIHQSFSPIKEEKNIYTHIENQIEINLKLLR